MLPTAQAERVDCALTRVRTFQRDAEWRHLHPGLWRDGQVPAAEREAGGPEQCLLLRIYFRLQVRSLPSDSRGQ